MGNMEWVKIAIPLIAVAVWLLSTLARGTRDDRRPTPRPRETPAGGDAPPRPRRPVSDIDRFLEEVNRRRREAGERAKPDRPEATPPAAGDDRSRPPLPAVLP